MTVFILFAFALVRMLDNDSKICEWNMLDLCLDCGRVSIMQSINPIANTLFYKEHITDTLDFLKQVYTPEVCDKLEADRLDDLINRDGCAVQ